jgi:hypothetical protein
MNELNACSFYWERLHELCYWERVNGSLPFLSPEVQHFLLPVIHSLLYFILAFLGQYLAWGFGPAKWEVLLVVFIRPVPGWSLQCPTCGKYHKGIAIDQYLAWSHCTQLWGSTIRSRLSICKAIECTDYHVKADIWNCQRQVDIEWHDALLIIANLWSWISHWFLVKQ